MYLVAGKEVMAKLPPVSDEDRENLVAYLDGELDARAARALEAKLNLDAEARAEADALRRTWEMLDYLPRPEATATFSSRTLERVSSQRLQALPAPAGNRPWPGWALGAGWAAALLVAGVLGFLAVRSLSETRSASAVATRQVDENRLLVRDLRLIENKRLYELVGDINFLRELDDPDLFGDDS
jgi:anti-sigma factor RsiW